ncbi:MAG: DUF6531 domain-containing protein [Nitrosomonas sp.]|nr:DUF6531 domain-containing protein [Nitrosomonas sp.]
MSRLKLFLLIFLFVLSFNVSSKITDNSGGLGTHFLIEEWYVQREEALQACHDFVTKHGYGHEYCRTSSANNMSGFEAGWLWAVKEVTIIPSELGVFYYDISCPLGTALDKDTGNCIPTFSGTNSGRPQVCISNPVNAATGNKYAEAVDISYPSELIFSRHYNSESLSIDTQIGFLWRHNYQHGLSINSETISATRTDGRTVYFELTNDVWINQQSSNESLTRIVNTDGDTTGWQLLSNDDSIEHYNASGKLQSITNRDGRTQTLAYDTANRLVTVTDDIGRALHFSYDASSRIDTITDPAGNLYQYAYDDRDNLTSVTYPDGKVRTYHYNEPAYTSGADLPHALTGITDENGARYATYTYDAQGRAIVTEHAGGADRHVLNYSADGSSTVVIDPLGSEYTHQFQTILGVARSTGQSQPAGSGCSAASSAITHDANGNATSRTDFNGNKTCYAFDMNRNLEIARVEGLAAGSACPGDLVNYTPVANSSERKILTDWHADFRLPVRVLEANRETTTHYDAYGNVTQQSMRDLTTNETRTWNTSYSYHGSIPGVIVQQIIDGPRTDVSDITTIHYYTPDENCLGGHFGCRGQVSHVTNALGHTTQITRYNAYGQPEAIVDANNLTTTLTYDARQRLLTRTVGTETTRYAYDGVGQLIRVTNPDNSTLNYTYDAARRLTGMTDSLGNAIQYTLDAAGNRIKEEIFDSGGALAQTRQQEFDALSRLWKMIGAQSQVMELAYDANGNLKQTTDPLLHTTARQFDALDRLIKINDPAGGQTLQQHNALDQLAKVTDPKGIETTYTMNAFGDVLQENSKDRGITTYTYDAAGNRVTRTDARGVVQKTVYDAINRPIKQTYASGPGIPYTAPVIWTYDTGSNGIGRLAAMTDESGKTTYQYDALGRLLSKTQTVVTYQRESFTHTVSYQYDSSGRLSQTTYPSGTKISKVYGADGRPVELRINDDVLLHDITYHPFGAPKSWTWGNGRVHHRSFDLDGRLTQHPLGADTQTLTYDAANRIVSTTQSNPIYNRAYDYDVLDRLIRQGDSTTVKLWDYDANSNRILEQSGATIYPYTIDASSNRLLKVAGPAAKTYAYDVAGNAVTDGTLVFAWNAAGRLSSVSTGKKAVVFSLYNGHGERTLKAKPQGRKVESTLFVYDPVGKLIGDYSNPTVRRKSGVWQLNQETVWFGDIPVAVIKLDKTNTPIQVYYIHADHLNTPRMIVDSNNTPVWQWNNRNAFGDNLPDEDPDGNHKTFEYNLRFAGQYFDTETNLHYNYFRDYEPATGRYLSSDPIGLRGGLNVYGYVNGQPVISIDPDGLRGGRNRNIRNKYGSPYFVPGRVVNGGTLPPILPSGDFPTPKDMLTGGANMFAPYPPPHAKPLLDIDLPCALWACRTVDPWTCKPGEAPLKEATDWIPAATNVSRPPPGNDCVCVKYGQDFIYNPPEADIADVLDLIRKTLKNRPRIRR